MAFLSSTHFANIFLISRFIVGAAIFTWPRENNVELFIVKMKNGLGHKILILIFLVFILFSQEEDRMTTR